MSVEGKAIYRVVFGKITKMTAVSETKQGYKAKSSRGNTWQLWKKRMHSGGSRHMIFHVEKCFFNGSSAIKYAREQLKEMEMHHKYKSEEYFKASGKLDIEVL